MDATTFETLHDSAVVPASRRIHRAVQRFGWDQDDCRQQGAVILLGFPADVLAKPTPYITTCLVRAIYREAKPTHHVPTVEEVILANATGTNRDEQIADLHDMIASAPYDIERYLRAVVLDGLSWDAARGSLSWSNRRMAQTRLAAALWLEEQYDGRRSIREGTVSLRTGDTPSKVAEVIPD